MFLRTALNDHPVDVASVSVEDVSYSSAQLKAEVYSTDYENSLPHNLFEFEVQLLRVEWDGIENDPDSLELFFPSRPRDGDFKENYRAHLMNQMRDLAFEWLLCDEKVTCFAGDAVIQNSEGRPSIIVSSESFAKSAHLLMNELDGTIETRASFVRMLYFSSATATTLGYGDIVPVDDYGRILVTIQTLLSVVLIGVFLNSLAVSQANTGPSKQKEPPQVEGENQ